MIIKEFEINDYKCFKDFKIDKLSQINIISGKNNVGKTALLEALSVSKNTTNLRLFKKNIEYIFASRGLNYNDIYIYLKSIFLDIKYLDKKIVIQSKHNTLTEEEHEKLKQQYVNPQVKEFLVMYYDDIFEDILPLEINQELSSVEFQTLFINSSRPNNYYLTHLYSKVQELNKQDAFLKYLQIIDNNIIGIEPYLTQIIAHDGQSVQSTVLRITVENPLQSFISSELGEGTNRFIEILCSLLANTNGTVLIDEIENGIHHTKLYDIWKAIIEIVDKENIQLFVTTHDEESIEALNRASEDMKYYKITSLTLEKDEDNTIYPIIRKYSSFTATVDAGMDIR
ncbi:MAG: AAA family ATPase [Sulfurovum sp.]